MWCLDVGELEVGVDPSGSCGMVLDSLPRILVSVSDLPNTIETKSKPKNKDKQELSPWLLLIIIIDITKMNSSSKIPSTIKKVLVLTGILCYQ